MDLEIADDERRMAVDETDVRQHRARRAEGHQRAIGQIDRKMVTARKPRDAAGMIVVLVRDEDGGEIARREAQAAEPRSRLLEIETAVDQDAGRARFDDETVAVAAAAE